MSEPQMMEIDGADQQVRDNDREASSPLEESNNSAPSSARIDTLDFMNAPVKKFFPDLGWKTGKIVSLLAYSEADNIHEQSLASTIQKSVDHYRVRFGPEITEEYPVYILEDLVELAQVGEGSKVAIYSYDADKPFHAKVLEVDDSKINNIHAVFENERREWVDLRRFKFQLVDPEKPRFKLPHIAKGVMTPGKEKRTSSKVLRKSPREDQASQTDPDEPPLNEERAVQTDTAGPTETSAKIQPPTTKDHTDKGASQTEKSAIPVETKSVQTDATEKPETEKSVVTEERGFQTDEEKLKATKERGIQTEDKDDGERRQPDSKDSKKAAMEIQTTPSSKGTEATSTKESAERETQTLADELTPRAEKQIQTRKEELTPTVDAACQTEEVAQDAAVVGNQQSGQTSKEALTPTVDAACQTEEMVHDADTKGSQQSSAPDPQPSQSKAKAVASRETAEGEINTPIPEKPPSPTRKKVGTENTLLVLKQPHLSKIQKNTKIAVFWENSQEYYAATVLAVRKSKQRNSYHLEYEPDMMREWTILATREFYLFDDFVKYESHLASMRKNDGALSSENIMNIKRQEEEKLLSKGGGNPPLLKEALIRTELPDDVKKWADIFASRQKTLGVVGIGTRVAVWWHGEKRFFKGTVTDTKSKKGVKTFHVTYDDGDKQWLNFEREVFIVLVPPAGMAAPSIEDLDDDESQKKPAASDTKEAKSNGMNGSKSKQLESDESPTRAAAEADTSEDVPPIYRVSKGSLIEVFERNHSGESAVVKDRRQGDLPFLVEFMDGRSKWMDLGQVKFRLIEGSRSRGSNRASPDKHAGKRKRKSTEKQQGLGPNDEEGQKRSSGPRKLKKRRTGDHGENE